jgi:hypothetical protein
MLRLGNAWADARGKLLRAPLDTVVHFLKRERGLDALTRRANGRSLRLKNVDPELEERDELRHASRWWLSAARARPGTPLGAQARWKALEAMPQIAAASEYAEQLAREIRRSGFPRDLREVCWKPDSIEPKRLTAYWSLRRSRLRTSPMTQHPSATRIFSVAMMISRLRASCDTYPPGRHHQTHRFVAGEAVTAEPATMATEVREIDALVKKNMPILVTPVTRTSWMISHSFSPSRTSRRDVEDLHSIRFDVLESMAGIDRAISNSPGKGRRIRAELT